jgi:hypothetical protein
MARQKKQQSVEEGARLAEELIRAQAELRNKDEDESALDDDTPVDDLHDDSLNLQDDLDGGDFDLSKLDDEVDDEPPENKDLAHKFSVLQGKYNTETKRLSDLLSQTMAELQELKQRVPDKSSNIPDIIDDSVDVEKLKNQFPTIFNSLVALAKREAEKATKGTVDKVDAIVQQTEVERKKSYYSNLTKEVPLWEKINVHPSWIKWLSEVDEFSGTTRQNLINAAYNRMDYITTAKFFRAFMAEKGIKVKDKSVNDDDIAPDVTGTSVNRSTKQSKNKITRAYVEKFYKDKAQGKLIGTEAEIAKQEAAIYQAVAEGRYER